MRAKLRKFGSKIAAAYRHFMLGRYGTDKLNTAILCAGLVCCLLSSLTGLLWAPLKVVFLIAAYGFLIWALVRGLSRNTYGRYRENTAFLNTVKRLKDREHRYYACPKCGQVVRVPRGKGRISIACPKCCAKFVRKT